MTVSARHRGQYYEELALQYLQRQGLSLLVRNWHSRLGELDMVMLEDDELVFVEVRYRKNQLFGGALDSITPAKQQKIIAAATAWLQQHPEQQMRNCRFDVVAMHGNDQAGYGFNWVQQAFTL